MLLLLLKFLSCTKFKTLKTQSDQVQKKREVKICSLLLLIPTIMKKKNNNRTGYLPDWVM